MRQRMCHLRVTHWLSFQDPQGIAVLCPSVKEAQHELLKGDLCTRPLYSRPLVVTCFRRTTDWALQTGRCMAQSIESEQDGYLQHCAKLAILGAGKEGYMCAGTTGTATMTVQMEEPVDNELPQNFERCVWSILPVDRTSGGEDKKYVKYGDLVLLQHGKTGRNVAVRTNLPSENAPNCLTVDFEIGKQPNLQV